MLGFKPNHEMWARVNAVIMGENMAEVTVTFISALCSMLIQAGAATDEAHARAHLAALLLSPDSSAKAGSLLPLLAPELAKLRREEGVWIT
jgi:hypothetical protein